MATRMSGPGVSKRRSPRAPRCDGVRNRAHLVEVASLAFRDEGFNVGVDEIARRAEVSVATLYRHFATKDALLSELVYEKFVTFCGQARQALAAEGPAFDRFASLLRENAEVMARDAGTRFALMHASDSVWARAMGPRDELFDLVRPLVAQAQEDGDLRRDFDPDEIGVLMSGVCATMDIKPDAWRRQLDILLDGLRAR